MTLLWRQLRDESIARLAAAGIEDPRQELRWITERASGRTGAEQVGALDEPATAREVSMVDQMVARRAAGEPLQYVLGRWGFRTLDMLVDGRVLIPRPETEVVAGLAISALADRSGPALAVDLGTGSGAIALSLAAEVPALEVWGTDVSADALAVARANLAGLGTKVAPRVRLVEGSWFDALPADLVGAVDLIVSNPPYVAEGEDLPDEVAAWEPTGALFAGPTGLECMAEIVHGAPAWLSDAGALVLEIAPHQAGPVSDLCHDAGFADIVIHADLAGRDSVVRASCRG
ncbi:MAG: peptide chain release factor N(5)-glutamine methyltransferase [Acidimicrobiales bacterium]